MLCRHAARIGTPAYDRPARAVESQEYVHCRDRNHDGTAQVWRTSSTLPSTMLRVLRRFILRWICVVRSIVLRSSVLRSLIEEALLAKGSDQVFLEVCEGLSRLHAGNEGLIGWRCPGRCVRRVLGLIVPLIVLLIVRLIIGLLYV